MMKKINIRLNSGNFPIYLGDNILEKLPLLLNEYSKYIVLIDENIVPFYRDKLKKYFLILFLLLFHLVNIIKIFIPLRIYGKNYFSIVQIENRY